MPERNRLPYYVEMQARIERMQRARAAEQDALLIVRHFNARLSTRRTAGFWPTIRTALTAKHHWAEVLCESCGIVNDFDLSMKPRHPETPISVALREVRCPRCNGHGRPRIIGLSRHPS